MIRLGGTGQYWRFAEQGEALQQGARILTDLTVEALVDEERAVRSLDDAPGENLLNSSPNEAGLGTARGGRVAGSRSLSRSRRSTPKRPLTQKISETLPKGWRDHPFEHSGPKRLALILGGPRALKVQEASGGGLRSRFCWGSASRHADRNPAAAPGEGREDRRTKGIPSHTGTLPPCEGLPEPARE